MNRSTVSIALLFLLAGFALAWFLAGGKGLSTDGQPGQASGGNSAAALNNPFSPLTDNARLGRLEDDVEQIKQQLTQIEQMLSELQSQAAVEADTTNAMSAQQQAATAGENMSSLLNQRLFNLDNLIRGGIDPAIAEDLVRRKNRVELKRLQLQDKARRENYLNTQRYYDELEAINSQDISLRDELGEDEYDRYLFNSRLTNRVRVNSVMLGSAAEEAGIRKNDIILSYDNRRVFNWQELKQATAEGQLGEYVSITILRDGSVFSFNVPRGPLGVQLGVARLEP